MQIEYRNEAYPSNDLTEVTVESYEWPPKHKMPSKFRCHVCLQLKPKAKYAGHLADKPICTTCIKYADEQDVGYLTKVDGYHRLAGPSGSITQWWKKEEERTPEHEDEVLDWWNNEYVPHHLGRRVKLGKLY